MLVAQETSWPYKVVIFSDDRVIRIPVLTSSFKWGFVLSLVWLFVFAETFIRIITRSSDFPILVAVMLASVCPTLGFGVVFVAIFERAKKRLNALGPDALSDQKDADVIPYADVEGVKFHGRRSQVELTAQGKKITVGMKKSDFEQLRESLRGRVGEGVI